MDASAKPVQLIRTFESDIPMHEIEVEIIKLQLLERFPSGQLDIFGMVVAVSRQNLTSARSCPHILLEELACHEEVLAIDTGIFDTLANLLLVAIRPSAINVSVPTLDGVRDCLANLSGFRLPCSATTSSVAADLRDRMHHCVVGTTYRPTEGISAPVPSLK